jgi:hypothetical protein
MFETNILLLNGRCAVRRNLFSIDRFFACLALLLPLPCYAANDQDSSGLLGAGTRPSHTLAAYFEVLRQRNDDPQLDIYTPATRRMLEDWAMTPGQMDNLVNTYSRCHAESARIDQREGYAVIRYPVAERQCAPWFFQLINGKWALDLTMMQRAIRFGSGNAWRFEPSARHPYDFAFADWAFDTRGFPRND